MLSVMPNHGDNPTRQLLEESLLSTIDNVLKPLITLLNDFK